jgi:hypothetical protein
MLSSLTTTDVSPLKYIFRAWIIALVPTILIGLVVGLVCEPKENMMGRDTQPVHVAFLGMVVFSPVLETLLMRVVFWFLRKITQVPLKLVVWSAILWALLHSLAWLPWGIIVFWGFVVFSTCYLSWEKVSRWRAFWITSATHAMLNLIPAMLIVINKIV